MRFIEDFKEGENIVGHYLCKQKKSGRSKSGKQYFSLTLVDKTGSVEAKIWDLNNNIQNFDEGDFIKIDADVNIYVSEIQLRVNKLRRSMEGEYDPRDYIPCTDKNIDSLYRELCALIKSVANKHLRTLLEGIVIDDTWIKDRMLTHSAARNMHHSYMGGLLEHTLSVAQTCDFFAPRYKYVNRDLLITAAILHDIGKIYELSPFPDNEYTDSGQLLGHIVMGVELISARARDIDGFPETLLLLLKHCLLAHHGEFEFGSPKLPEIIEAVILHAADNLDAKAKAFEEAVAENKLTGNWLGYNKIFQRNIRTSEY